MKKAILVDNKLTITLDDGTIVYSSEATQDLVYQLQNMTDEEIKKQLAPELCKEEEKLLMKKTFTSDIETFIEEDDRFYTEQDALYLEGIKISIPELLAEKIMQRWRMNTQYEDLVNFWKWCSLNPNPESRDDLFNFLSKHGMHITKEGMVLAYRNMWKVGNTNNDLVEFVSKEYFKIKGMKKAPKNYKVYKKSIDNTYYRTTGTPGFEDTLIGNLEELYLDAPSLSETQFTDDRTGKEDYRIGKEARMERTQGNQSNQVSCSRGYHVASKEYSYSGFGDTHVLVVFNPMDVLACPVGQISKMRVCAFTLIAVLDGNEDNPLEEDLDTYSELLHDHIVEQVNNLDELLKANTPYELRINNILNVGDNFSLDGIKELIKDRVVSE